MTSTATSKITKVFATAVTILVLAMIIGFLTGVTVWIWKVML